MTTVKVVKFLDGKAIEHWTYMDMKEMISRMSQMKIGNKMDSSKIENK